MYKIKDLIEIVNTMNNFYIKIGEELSIEILQLLNKEIQLPDLNPKFMFILLTDQIEIYNIIQNME